MGTEMEKNDIGQKTVEKYKKLFFSSKKNAAKNAHEQT